MKKEERKVYSALVEAIDANLCTFCKYASFVSDGCCEGYAECEHPIDNLSYQCRYEEELSPGDDCCGFRPEFSVSIIADIVGSILVSGWNEWAYIRYGPRNATVYGRHWIQGKENAGKVRIGVMSRETK